MNFKLISLHLRDKLSVSVMSGTVLAWPARFITDINHIATRIWIFFYNPCHKNMKYSIYREGNPVLCCGTARSNLNSTSIARIRLLVCAVKNMFGAWCYVANSGRLYLLGQFSYFSGKTFLLYFLISVNETMWSLSQHSM